ncbi:MAG: hypothetical protein ACI841_004809, partial [Planctomycetota bacterium]
KMNFDRNFDIQLHEALANIPHEACQTSHLRCTSCAIGSRADDSLVQGV